MISSNDFRTGVTIEIDGDAYQVIEFMHVKPGKGSPFVRSKLKNMRTGSVVERTFRAGEKLPMARLERREMQYLYSDGDSYVFMDTGNYEQLPVDKDAIGPAVRFLKENMNVYILQYSGQILGVDLPNAVELRIVETEPGIRGDTATGATKQAVLETGAVVQVPLFVEVGQAIRVDTRTGNYLERA